MSEWKTIDSAPRDGTYIIINGMKNGGVCEAKWFKKYGNWKLRGGNFALPDSPTHWQPLPPPPNKNLDPDQQKD